MSRHHAPKKGCSPRILRNFQRAWTRMVPRAATMGTTEGVQWLTRGTRGQAKWRGGLVTRVPVCSNIVTEGWTSPPLTFRRRLLMEMVDLTEDESVAIRDRIAVLSIEHRDLDEVIARLSEDPVQDELQLKRLKRRKLMLKDHITVLERQLVPDARA